MGDARFTPLYERVRDAANRMQALRSLTDEDVIGALAEGSRQNDPLMANVLATEAQNRIERGRRIVDALPDAIIALDRESNVTFLNPAAERVLGWLLPEVKGRRLVDVLPIIDAQVRADTLDACRHGRGVRFERASIGTRTGRRVVVTLRCSPMIHAGNLAGSVVALSEEPPGLRGPSGGAGPTGDEVTSRDEGGRGL